MSKYLGALAQRFDTEQSAIMARELESIERQVTKTLYPALRARDFIPMIPGIDAGADLYTWRRSDVVGEAKLIANRGNDLPDVDISLTENYQPIRVYGDQYHYTTEELRRFALARARGSSISLDTDRANAAREFIERKTDYVLTFGESLVSGMTGFANNSSVTLVTPLFGTWSTATAQQILADLFYLERSIITASKGQLEADTLLLPVASYAIVATTPLGVNNDRTILDFFKANAQSVRAVDKWYRLDTADVAGTGPRAIMYSRKVEYVGGINPLVFQAQPPQPHGLEWQIPCESKCGGTVVKMPLSMSYMDGL